MTIQRIVAIFAAAALTLVPGASASHLAMPESALFHNGKIYVSLIGDHEDNDGAVVKVAHRAWALHHAEAVATARRKLSASR